MQHLYILYLKQSIVPNSYTKAYHTVVRWSVVHMYRGGSRARQAAGLQTSRAFPDRYAIPHYSLVRVWTCSPHTHALSHSVAVAPTKKTSSSMHPLTIIYMVPSCRDKHPLACRGHMANQLWPRGKPKSVNSQCFA
jgi:hypothetical protein